MGLRLLNVPGKERFERRKRYVDLGNTSIFYSLKISQRRF